MAISPEKAQEFTARGGDPGILETLLAQQDATEKAADAAGVVYKEAPDLIATLKQELGLSDEQAAKLQALTEKAAPMMDMEAEPSTEEEDMAEDATEVAQAAGGPLFMQEDIDALRPMIKEELSAALAPLAGLLDIERKIQGHVQTMMGGYTAKKDDEIAALKEALAKAAADQAQTQTVVQGLNARLKELEGDGASGFRASQHPSTALTPATKEGPTSFGEAVNDFFSSVPGIPGASV